MDEKFSRRYESFCNSLKALSEARERDFSDSFVMSGTGAKFAITFDLAWKVTKDVLREAFKANLIDDDDWMEMLKVRYELTHDYDGAVVKAHCEMIVGKYIDLFYEFEDVVKGIVNKY